MDLIKQFIDLVLHLDQHLSSLVASYGTWTYAILFLIIFCETGLVVTPFLPGDSLLFAVGAMATLPESPLSLRSEEHTSELQSRFDLVCRLLLEKKKIIPRTPRPLYQQPTCTCTILRNSTSSDMYT